MEPVLSPAHQGMLLTGSAISERVVRERGYRTVGTKSELARLGFPTPQQLTPTLLVPLYTVHGEIGLYHHRPDRPRMRDGRVVKYEFPAGGRMVVDVHPSLKASVRDPRTPLFITEGIKKADAATSRGLCCIGVVGTWNFRGTNEYGGLTALPDWEGVAFKGKDDSGQTFAREVYICYDSDVMLKPQVHQALVRLAAFVKHRGARVRYIYLPAGDGATKTGLDDFLASGRSVDDLLGYATTELREQPNDAAGGGGEDSPIKLPYQQTARGLVWQKRMGEGVIPVPLTNFSAQIVADTLEDDGAETRRVFTVQATLNGQVRCFDLPAEQFGAMNWPTAFLGARAVVYPGQGIKDNARTAIQLLSEAEERRVRTHVGWVEVESGVYGYCHAGGVIGPVSGDAVQMRLTEQLSRFSLPTAPSPGSPELCEAVAAVVRLLRFGRPDVVVPVIAAALRAVLGGADFSVFVVGPTGVFKTELAALAQQFYGPTMTARNLPADWSATDNYLEGLAFAAKDALLVVDEFVPRGGVYDRERHHAKADRVLRAQGNHAARGRMRADGTLRPAKPPRCLIVATGEDVPHGQSLRARMFVIEVGPGDLPADGLSAFQQDARKGAYATALAGFLDWLAPQYPAVRGGLRDAVEKLRSQVGGGGVGSVAHRRTPEIAANLTLGLRYFLRYAVAAGAMPDDEADALFRWCWQMVGKAAAAQSGYQEDNEPTRRYLQLLSAAIASGKAHLATLEGKEPNEDAAACGWRGQWVGTREYERQEWRAQGDRIGFLDGDNVYLLPDPAYQCANRMASESGDGVAVKPRTLSKRLHERGLLVTADTNRSRLLTRITACGVRHEVLHLRKDALLLEKPSQSSQPTQSGKG